MEVYLCRVVNTFKDNNYIWRKLSLVVKKTTTLHFLLSCQPSLSSLPLPSSLPNPSLPRHPLRLAAPRHDGSHRALLIACRPSMTDSRSPNQTLCSSRFLFPLLSPVHSAGLRLLCFLPPRHAISLSLPPLLPPSLPPATPSSLSSVPSALAAELFL